MWRIVFRYGKNGSRCSLSFIDNTQVAGGDLGRWWSQKMADLELVKSYFHYINLFQASKAKRFFSLLSE